MEKWPPGFEYRRVFESPAVQISRWRCRGATPRLGAERAQPSALILFMHTGNFRVHSSAQIGLLDCTRVGFFNPRVPFQSAHPFGARDSGCDLAVRSDVLAEILAKYDSSAADRPELPFRLGSSPCEPRTFLMHRILMHRVGLGEPIDDLEIEETSLHLADRVARAAFGDPAGRTAPRMTVREREEAEELRGILSSHPGHRHALDTLARRLGSTPFRLCRSFRIVTGTTIHRHLTHLRLQQALGRLADGAPDLTSLAFDLGFSSHSHFTSVFRKHLGISPDEIRRAATRRDDLPSLGSPFAPTAAARN